MRVLVTGSAGFLGRHFVRAHLADGDEVHGVDDLSAHPDGPLDVPDDVMDVTEVWDLLEWMKHPLPDDQFDLAYHFAAPVGGRVKIEGDPLFNAAYDLDRSGVIDGVDLSLAATNRELRNG